jgi:hypothetical protein
MMRKAKTEGTFHAVRRTNRQGWTGVPRERSRTCEFLAVSEFFAKLCIARKRA